MNSKFQELLAARKAEAARLAAEQAIVEPVFDADLIPGDDLDRSDEDQSIDAALERVGILDAYQRWCGKMRPLVRPGQHESIMVSCPNPSHPDKNPSAWVNTRNNTGNCALCGGFDKFIIAGWNKGIDPASSDFPKLRREMAEDLGWTFERALGGEWEAVPPSVVSVPEDDTVAKTAKSPKPDIVPETVTDEPVSNVVELFEHEEIVLPTLDVQKILPHEGTFLDEYCAVTDLDEAPPEYHFVNGLVALSLAVGRQVRLQSRIPVLANLFVVDVGGSGTGKSLALRPLYDLLDKALPYDYTNPINEGAKTTSPSSAEKLIDVFSAPIYDPVNPKIISMHAPVKGLVLFDEFANLVSKAQRIGNPIKTVLMEFYDGKRKILSQSMANDKLAEDSYACCITSTQPDLLQNLLSNEDAVSGFVNRWLFVCGVGERPTMMGKGQVDINQSAALLKNVTGWAASFKRDDLVTYEDDALRLMTYVVEQTVRDDITRSESAVFNRMDLSIQKIVLLLAINEQRKQVTLDIVERAIIFYRYMKACYEAVAGRIGTTDNARMEEGILYQIGRLDKGNGVPIGAIKSALKNRKYDTQEFMKVFEALIKLGVVEEVREAIKKAGRPTKRYRHVV